MTTLMTQMDLIQNLVVLVPGRWPVGLWIFLQTGTRAYQAQDCFADGVNRFLGMRFEDRWRIIRSLFDTSEEFSRFLECHNSHIAAK